MQLSSGGCMFTPRGPQNNCCGTPAELHREQSAAADATACGYGDSSRLLAVRLPPAWNHVVIQRASSSLHLSHRFTSALVGDPCMGLRDFQRERQWEDTTNNICSTQKTTASNTTVISNHNRTPLSYEDVVQQHHSFHSTAVVQFGRSRGGRLSLSKKWNFQPPAAVWW